MSVVIIPARYQSARLAGKLLLDLEGKPLLQHTFEQARQAKVDRVIVATDDQRIEREAKNFGADVIMTSTTHQSGTERLAECVDLLGLSDDEIVINVQGDEPFLPAQLIEQVGKNLTEHQAAVMATLCEPIAGQTALFSPHNVKVIFNEQGYANYFSRAVIPWYRDGFENQPLCMPKDYQYYRHVGLYAYRASFIKEYVNLPPSPWEQVEQLEQLRVLWHGQKIHVDIANADPGIGVDTESDLEAARALLREISGAA